MPWLTGTPFSSPLKWLSRAILENFRTELTIGHWINQNNNNNNNNNNNKITA